MDTRRRKEPPTLDEIESVTWWWCWTDPDDPNEEPIPVEVWPEEYGDRGYKPTTDFRDGLGRLEISGHEGWEWEPCLPRGASQPAGVDRTGPAHQTALFTRFTQRHAPPISDARREAWDRDIAELEETVAPANPPRYSHSGHAERMLSIHELATARLRNPPLDHHVAHDLGEIAKLSAPTIAAPGLAPGTRALGEAPVDATPLTPEAVRERIDAVNAALVSLEKHQGVCGKRRCSECKRLRLAFDGALETTIDVLPILEAWEADRAALSQPAARPMHAIVEVARNEETEECANVAETVGAAVVVKGRGYTDPADVAAAIRQRVALRDHRSTEAVPTEVRASEAAPSPDLFGIFDHRQGTGTPSPVRLIGGRVYQNEDYARLDASDRARGDGCKMEVRRLSVAVEVVVGETASAEATASLDAPTEKPE